MADSAVWLDMDPGIDDAWALIVAQSRLQIHGVSTVAGNVPVASTYQNAHEVLRLLDRADIPVFLGAARPLLAEPMTAKSFHGESGLGAWTPHPISRPDPSRTILAHWARTAPARPLHLIATGPLTNLALGYLALPDFAARWASVTVMCGATPGVRADKHDEFNIFVDPHAADVVFRRGERVQVVGINVAHRALLPLSDLTHFGRYGAVGRFLTQALGFYSERARGEGGLPDAFPVDDVVAVAAVMAPELFTWAEMPLTVVREGPMRGALVVTPADQDRPPVAVATAVDAKGFRDFVWAAMEVYRDRSG